MRSMADETLWKRARRSAAMERPARGDGRVSSARERVRRALRLARCAVLGPLISGCLYDAEVPCSPGQVLVNDAVCVCAEGSALTDQGCVPCGQNEVAGANGCVCADGTSRAAEGAPCEAGPSALGVACDTQGAPCSDAAYNVCHVTSDSGGSATGGYCTEACTSSEDCEGGYACDVAATPTYCRRPPTGMGLACASNDDCAGNEASFCEGFMLHQCVVANCSTAAQDCFPGTKCCDFTAFGAPAPFCLPDGAC